MDHIMQRSQFDCGVACTAMLYGLTYEEAEAQVPFRCGDPNPESPDGLPLGLTSWDVNWIGLRMGIPASVVLPRESLHVAQFPAASLMVVPNSNELWHWLRGRHAVLCVGARRQEGRFHCIAWDGHRILDPLQKRHPANYYGPHERPQIVEAVVRMDRFASPTGARMSCADTAALRSALSHLDSGGSFTAKQLAALTHRPLTKNFSNAVQYLERRGELLRVARGRYRPNRQKD